MTRLLVLSNYFIGIFSFSIILIFSNFVNASEPCVETYQVDCGSFDAPYPNKKPNQIMAKSETKMQTLFYSGGILSNQIPSTSKLRTEINYESAFLDSTNIPENNSQINNNLIDAGVANVKLLILRKNFYDHSDKNRRTTQKCLRDYGYNGKIDGVWGDKTYFALLSYQEADIEVEESNIFDGIRNIVANFRNCDEVLDQILE